MRWILVLSAGALSLYLFIAAIPSKSETEERKKRQAAVQQPHEDGKSDLRSKS